jgi:chromosome segregation protein
MRIEKIELTGFKSFSDKTVLQLHPGITCIVGPNGCGKSNVVDAFKWVLGEQSAKSLRGGKMEEVIFVGSQSRKPKGMADVTLHVSGLGSSGNGEDSITKVTRRLYRSGDSEYQLNRQSCRLRDIRDLFLDTGLEVKSYSIMEQDRIAAILTARPEDRRFIIEEVAGVVKYRVRRNEAQSKLESSRNNLQRINDITAEIRRQINSLDRQVKRAERYKKLMQEQRTIELRLAKDTHGSLTASLDGILKELESVKENDALLRAELTRAEADIETRRIGLAEAEKELDAVKQELQRIEKDMSELERAVAVSKNDKENLKEYTVKLRHQEEENQDKRRAAEQRKQEVADSQSSLNNEAGSLSETLSEKEGALKAVEADISEKEARLEDKRGEALKASEDLSALRAEGQRHQAALESLQGREDSLTREISDLGVHRSAVEASLRNTHSIMLARKNDTIILNEENSILSGEIQELRDRLEELRAETSRAREALASASSRLSSLEEMASGDSEEGALEGVNILSSVSDAIEVRPEYERAVETALSEIIKGYILSSRPDAMNAARGLKEKGGGRTAFVPLDAGPGAGQGALPEGALAWASDVVSVREEYSAVIRNLLSNVALVRDLDTTAGIPGGTTLATLDGEILTPGGVVIAGKSRGLLTLKRQIRETRDEKQRWGEKTESLGKEAEGLASTLEGREEELRSLKEKAVEIEKEVSVLRLEAERQSEELERTDRKVSTLRLEQAEVSGEKESLKALIQENAQKASALEERRRLIDTETGDIQASISVKKSEQEQRRAEAVEIRLSLNSCREKLNSLMNEGRSTEALLEELRSKGEFIAQESARTATRIGERERETEEKERSLKGLAVEAGGLSSDISRKREAISSELEQVTGLERGLRQRRGKIDETSQRLSELDVRRAEDKLRIETLKENIKNTYDVEIETVEIEPPEPEDQEQLDELKRKIENLGPVSLGSIEEHEELRDRFEFLTRQKEDLEKSIAELEEAITRINTTTRKRLREAFAALNSKFGEVFVTLFGGGRAELILTDENNILETGIDVVAQPPGKRLQNITLLSGGEKSLAAIALLFASFLIKPSPLCILDEADAALDESNTGKFSELLKDLARDIQFIVVTHNRITMETADYIYGVTMEEPGNSKTISLEMTETS